MSTAVQNDTVAVLESLSHTHFAECYQCGKCTAGCPMSASMDVVPNRLIRMLHLGDADSALRSNSIWQCVSCQTCSTRCPKNVDCAGIMDALRQVSYERHMTSPEQAKVVAFQKAFLDNIRRNGRLAEIELTVQFKMAGFAAAPRIGFLFKDSTLAPKMSARKKFHLFGEKVKDRAVVRRIFDRCMDGKQ